MTLRVQGTISINGAQAKAEAKAVASELRKVGTDATSMATASKEAASGASALGGASRTTAAELRALAVSEREAATAATTMEASHSTGAAGVAELTTQAKAVSGELRKVGTEAAGMGRGVREAGSGARILGAEARSTSAELRALAASERQAAADAVNMGRSHSIGASGVANLTAQFNDIGVMLAAGQNPLQLAIQQGTQITQVFGNMGAGAAVRGLGQALLSMISPLNLITIGGIAAGAAIVQWLFQAGEEAQSLEEQMDDLASSVASYAKAAEEARAPSEELMATYGRMASEAKSAAAAIAAAERAQAQARISGTARMLSGSFGGFEGQQGELIGSEYERTLFRLRTELGLTGQDAVQVARKLRELSEANGAEDVARAALAARDALVEAGVAADNELAVSLANLTKQASAFIGAFADNGALVDLGALIALQTQGVQSVIDAERERLAVVSAQTVMQNQILIFGRDSELVAQNRLAAEREIHAAALETAGASKEKVAQELAAWDAATGFNAEAAGMPGLMSATAAAASGIAANIWNAVTAMIELNNRQSAIAAYEATAARTGLSGPDGVRSEINGGGRFTPAVVGAGLRTPRVAGASAGRRGGRGDVAKEEADAVQDLIEKLEREVELERELDPIKREMIQHREALAAATAEERAKVEELIVQRERERSVTESLKWAGEQTGDALIDGLMGAGDATERLIDTLKRAVLQAVLLGNGPLGGLLGGGIFGGGGGGGGGGMLFDGLFSGGGLFAGLAEGGMVFGEGGPTDDKVPRWLSPGEFVVNARATRRHRHMLERLNDAPGMATGGIIAGGASPSSALAGGVTIAPVIDARGSQDPAAVEQAARRGMALALEEYRRTGLPEDIQRSLDSPYVRRYP